MKWKTRERQLAQLREKHGRVPPVVAFPDLGVKPGAPSLTATGVAKIVEKRAQPQDIPRDVIVDTLHKQGPMVLSRSELPWAGGKKP